MSAKSERDRRRAERLEAEKRQQSAERRRLLIGYVVAGGLSLAVIVGLVIVIGSSGDDGGGNADTGDFPEQARIEPLSGSVHGYAPDDREGTPPPAVEQGDLKAAAEAAGCELQLDLEDEGNNHVTKEEEIPDYGTNPATSGDHNPDPQADGAYSETPEPWYTLHALEHGRIGIQYSPDLSESEQLELKGLFDDNPAAILFYPNPDMPYAVAAAAWTQLMGCKTYEGAATLDALRAFRDAYRGRGPENVPTMLSG